MSKMLIKILGNSGYFDEFKEDILWNIEEICDKVKWNFVKKKK